MAITYFRNMPITVVCALIIRNDTVLCAQRSQRMALPLKWEFPGGKLEDGEAPEEALKREIMEELAIDITVGRALNVSEYTYENGRTIRLLPYLATMAIDMEPVANEHAELRWVKADDLLELDWAAADVPIVHEYLKLR
jgi:8-oxo-dGTP diphosphatase